MPHGKAPKRRLKNSSGIPTLHKLLFLLGIAAVCLSFAIRWRNRQVLDFTLRAPLAISTFKSGAVPVRIDIRRLNISLPVSGTDIVGGRWEIAEGGASHLIKSASPGDGGNVVIYAHNTRDRFGSLPKAASGDLVTVSTGDGNRHFYRIISSRIVSPDDISVVLPASTERLTLYTCTGFADSKRFVVKAEPVSPASINGGLN
ncbi:hypothetical protein A2Z33_05420 [Candidatus Gottesmanbacteria bacterium RBG_16_52_11]|uniref:Sortase n=1 Tax=Candidatus Gottesmanbacteria bacterium RBG_16_52_11 TaxID=1798374 RepID=A0A1F5YW34_9BACT|nr:MAG: hypothetical protein A2Z33_05420 [Candidatus Gottesmanbacteria bacterium RBG_16_52_11]